MNMQLVIAGMYISFSPLLGISPFTPLRTAYRHLTPHTG
jgi:hypothetical protein